MNLLISYVLVLFLLVTVTIVYQFAINIIFLIYFCVYIKLIFVLIEVFICILYLPLMYWDLHHYQL